MTDAVCSSCVAEGGDRGLLILRGCGPGEQKGRCLLGTGAGVPRGEVLMESCGGGVPVRPAAAGAGAALVQTVVAITFADGQRFPMPWSEAQVDEARVV